MFLTFSARVSPKPHAAAGPSPLLVAYSAHEGLVRLYGRGAVSQGCWRLQICWANRAYFILGYKFIAFGS
ncbi:hypothetical protein ERO13_A07G059800v2 [Gossypium hirsutum]|uniref:Uncharacterized protein n=1 Tax=Gossypium mustelinum TaxID=34275 RepID=A0A5D2YIA7_GOSMU|nr:hypothetical protein ERO13_A07G059800v2 [Gossypium hirsutum]TYJ25709.1 hypothetical protein E1A91_A07G068000v1 [Gossypium mustelinum]